MPLATHPVDVTPLELDPSEVDPVYPELALVDFSSLVNRLAECTLDLIYPEDDVEDWDEDYAQTLYRALVKDISKVVQDEDFYNEATSEDTPADVPSDTEQVPQ
jgi:hypothetical protein